MFKGKMKENHQANFSIELYSFQFRIEMKDRDGLKTCVLRYKFKYPPDFLFFPFLIA